MKPKIKSEDRSLRVTIHTEQDETNLSHQERPWDLCMSKLFLPGVKAHEVRVCKGEFLYVMLKSHHLQWLSAIQTEGFLRADREIYMSTNISTH